MRLQNPGLLRESMSGRPRERWFGGGRIEGENDGDGGVDFAREKKTWKMQKERGGGRGERERINFVVSGQEEIGSW